MVARVHPSFEDLPRAFECILEVLDLRLPSLARKEHRHHVDAHLAVLETVPPDVGVRQFRHPPLLAVADCFRGMTMLAAAAASHLDKHHRSSVESHDIDVAPQHSFTDADDAIALPLEIRRRLRFSAVTDRVPRGPVPLRHGLGHLLTSESSGRSRQEDEDVFPFPRPSFALAGFRVVSAASVRFSFNRTAFPTRSRR